MAAATPKTPRVLDEPAFVLQAHDWSESSQIIEVLSRHHGRVVLVAKGVKRPTSQFRAVLLPFQRLQVGWGGDADIKTLKQAVWQSGHVLPQGEALMAAYYLNELLLKLLARDDPYSTLFDHYGHTLQQLMGPAQRAEVLRAFELCLLREAGYSPNLDEEASSLAPVEPQGSYRLVPDVGLQAVSHQAEWACLGTLWLALQDAMSAEADTKAPDTERQVAEPQAPLLHRVLAVLTQAGPEHRSALRHQLRVLLHYHSGVRTFQTRQLLLDLPRLQAVASA
jgi:DNA repair protein RecO (recombination protein O)